MKLSEATLYVWLNAPHRFRCGAQMGPTQLALRLHLDPSTVLYHLRKLERAEYVQRIPQGPARGVYKGLRKPE